MQIKAIACAGIIAAGIAMIHVAAASPEEDRRTVAALDTEFQAAVKHNDAATIDRIHADDMILVLGNGKVVRGQELAERARRRAVTFEVQDEVEGSQRVRVWGDTAVVTALLVIKGSDAARGNFDYRVWFSDTYARIDGRWRYVLGQASLPLPKE